MNAHQRYLESPTAEDDDSAELIRRAHLAKQVRESGNPVDQLIVKIIEEGSVFTYTTPMSPKVQTGRTRTVEQENLILADASRIAMERHATRSLWNEANGEAMCRETPDVIEILGLLASGSDNCRLGELMVKVTRQAFAEACVSSAESLYP